LAHPISLSRNSGTSSYLCCTGVQADAVWLIRQMQTYNKVVQQRYGGTDRAEQAVAPAAAALVRALFWGYESNGDDNGSNDVAWQSSIQTVWRGQQRWGRPVGVRTLVVSPTATSSSPAARRPRQSAAFSLQIVEPSGVILHRPVFCCMGQQSDVLQTKLEKLLLDRQLQKQRHDDDVDSTKRPAALSENDVQALVRQALSATMVTPPSELQVEVISTRGKIQRKTWFL
jgi:hypothetical protein